MAEKPCCAAAAARKIRQIDVNGIPVGLYQLDEVLAEVLTCGLTDEQQIGDKLLKRIMIFNYVPPAMVQKYRDALLEEYKKYLLQSIKRISN